MVPRKPLPAGIASAATQPPVHSSAQDVLTVVFIRSHTHAGKAYVKGDPLVCDIATRYLLRQFGVIEED